MSRVLIKHLNQSSVPTDVQKEINAKFENFLTNMQVLQMIAKHNIITDTTLVRALQSNFYQLDMIENLISTGLLRNIRIDGILFSVWDLLCLIYLSESSKYYKYMTDLAIYNEYTDKIQKGESEAIKLLGQTNQQRLRRAYSSYGVTNQMIQNINNTDDSKIREAYNNKIIEIAHLNNELFDRIGTRSKPEYPLSKFFEKKCMIYLIEEYEQLCKKYGIFYTYLPFIGKLSEPMQKEFNTHLYTPIIYLELVKKAPTYTEWQKEIESKTNPYILDDLSKLIAGYL